MVILCLYVQTITRQYFCFPNSQWGVTAHDNIYCTQVQFVVLKKGIYIYITHFF